ncbi:MAG: putative transposase [Verrucomicrobiales bacterium]|jgi:putative transposase
MHESGDDQNHSSDSGSFTWPHAPTHRLSERGTYFVTAATYRKEHYFGSRKRLRILHDKLLRLADRFHWRLEAWAVFSNHYHFVAHSPEEEDDAASLSTFLAQLHSSTSTTINLLDGTEGRRVWHNFRDTQLTFESSYLARLNYTHQNPVKHGLVSVANQYPWCSAAWFERTASNAQVTTIYGVKTDELQNVDDDFEPYRG